MEKEGAGSKPVAIREMLARRMLLSGTVGTKHRWHTLPKVSLCRQSCNIRFCHCRTVEESLDEARGFGSSTAALPSVPSPFPAFFPPAKKGPSPGTALLFQEFVHVDPLPLQCGGKTLRADSLMRLRLLYQLFSSALQRRFPRSLLRASEGEGKSSMLQCRYIVHYSLRCRVTKLSVVTRRRERAPTSDLRSKV